MGSTHMYVMPTTDSSGGAAAKPKGAGMDLLNKQADTNVALDAADLESEGAARSVLSRTTINVVV
eukprot:SAG31_NODE_2697_length_5227_cov_1.318643_8_plen_65_part_00